MMHANAKLQSIGTKFTQDYLNDKAFGKIKIKIVISI